MEKMCENAQRFFFLNDEENFSHRVDSSKKFLENLINSEFSPSALIAIEFRARLWLSDESELNLALTKLLTAQKPPNKS